MKSFHWDSNFVISIVTTMPSSENDSEEYQVLPSAKSLNLPLGIRCMEINVQEVDEAVRQFTKNAADLTSSPSWKFPHVTLEKLDVSHVMDIFRSHKAISDNQLYMELMELLIDRLYYAIMTSYEFVNGLEAAFLNAGFETISDNASSRKSPKSRGDWDPLEIAKKSFEDHTSKPFHTANIGMLVRQFCLKMMGLENIVLNNIHSVKKSAAVINATTTTTSTSRSTTSRIESKNLNDSYYLLRHSMVQTEESSRDTCESCFIAQKILKYVAESVDKTLRTFNEADSHISQTRTKLRKDCLSITQRGALFRWLQALSTDCDSIMKCANMLLDINVKYQDDVRSLKEDIEIKEEQHEKQMQRVEKNVTDLKEELKGEQEIRTKISKLKDASVAKMGEMEKTLQTKGSECEKIIKEREVLQRGFNIAEELNLQIKSNLNKQTFEMGNLKRELEEERQQNENLAQQIKVLSSELARAGQELLRMNEKSEMLRTVEESNYELKNRADKLKIVADKAEAKDAELKKVLEDRDSKLRAMKKEMSQAQSKIEMLTLYPDLNGPINTPMRNNTGASCIETMEMQVKSNHIRMEILRAQSDRLTTAVSRLRNKMHETASFTSSQPSNDSL
ncbi:unnamed protein product [Orchesella dallaii]|uniref:Uncharacterized protein n=1 Tax=Orchesella dallaii TaxID=48710 RepID=A0ABP1QLL9_9HEXA